jgi:acetylglutamate/LysW-gamma-L-alpha-aminoadipate kinase
MGNVNVGAYTVVKMGGTAGVDFEAICEDVAGLVSMGERIILVHGGSDSANKLGDSLGKPARFVTSPSGFSSRFTDEATLGIFTMAVNGKINTEIVASLQMKGVNALGLSGVDGRLLLANRKSTITIVEGGKRKILRGDFSGKITTVNTELLRLLVSQGYTPVIAPLAVTAAGEVVNIDADRAAAMIAASLEANTLLLLSAIPGLLRHFPDEGSLISRLPQKDLDHALHYAQGRMKKKVLGAKEAIEGGVGRVVIADGRVTNPVSTAILGKGTVIT